MSILSFTQAGESPPRSSPSSPLSLVSTYPENDGGTSKVNMYNIAAAIEHIIWVIESGIARSSQIGIATTYGGQVDAYSNVPVKVTQDKPNLSLEDVLISTTIY